MLTKLSSDQDFFRDTTSKFLNSRVPFDELRRLRHDPAGFGTDYWRAGAELGWVSLLVDDAHGGGSISGNGLIDLMLIAHEFGRSTAPGPLMPSNVVAQTLSSANSHRTVLDDLVAGTAVAAWCIAEPAPHHRLGTVEFGIRQDGDTLVVSGVKQPVEAAGQADHLLVTGRTNSGLTQVIIPANTEGITITPLHSADLTRRFASVRFDDVRVPLDTAVGAVGSAEANVQQQFRHAIALSTAEAVGAMQAAFDLTVEWAFDRYSFGRPLASYQALKHRFADMKAILEASHAITDEAGAAVASDAREVDQMLSAAKAFVGDHGSELIQDCVQIHGGIGVTFEHDLHLFLRRHTVNRALFGTPTEHRLRLTDLVEQQKGAA